MSNILIFGGGQVSQGIQRALHDTAHEVHCVTSDTIDYDDFDAIRKYIVEKIKPDVVINTVAYTDVPGAEWELRKIKVQSLNVIFPIMASIWTNNIHSEFIHFSTNFVFDGKATEPYTEDSPTNPLQYYGVTKNRADTILNYRERTKIFRLAAVYSNHGRSFASQIEDQMTEVHTIDVVDDQIMQPSHSDWIGEVVVKTLAKPYYGLYNLVPDGHCSYADWAEKIVEGRCNINRISSDHMIHQQVQRPLYGVMDNSKIKTTFGLTFPTWEQVYDQYKY